MRTGVPAQGFSRDQKSVWWGRACEHRRRGIIRQSCHGLCLVRVARGAIRLPDRTQSPKRGRAQPLRTGEAVAEKARTSGQGARVAEFAKPTNRAFLCESLRLGVLGCVLFSAPASGVFSKAASAEPPSVQILAAGGLAFGGGTIANLFRDSIGLFQIAAIGGQHLGRHGVATLGFRRWHGGAS